jgi:hypothetical protein
MEFVIQQALSTSLDPYLKSCSMKPRIYLVNLSLAGPNGEPQVFLTNQARLISAFEQLFEERLRYSMPYHAK